MDAQLVTGIIPPPHSMAEQDSDLIALAGALADTADVDWDNAEASAATSEAQAVVRQLRQLAEISASARARLETWGSLQIRGPIGRGTFGTVYRAWDPQLQREIALKLLETKPGGTSVPDVIKEARLLAQIKHSNVVTVYGADEFDNAVGIWMELVSGQTLKDILKQQGPFGAPEAALIGRDLCRALSAVHQRGFLHRDIKAQNVMREAGGRTVLMDFGAGSVAVDSTVSLAGSPAYLAPELLEGQPATVRSDIYSLGVLLYHLVSGGFPVTGSSLDDFSGQHRARRRRPLIDLRPDLPAAFVRAVDRAIAVDPEERPESAGTFELLLDGTLTTSELPQPSGNVAEHPSSRVRNLVLMAAGVFAAIVVVSLTLFTSETDRINDSPQFPGGNSVAVLPFKDLSIDAADNYFGDGITQDVVAHLASIRDLRVVAGATSKTYADSSATEIGAALGVATVLSGTVRRADQRIRITSELVDTRTGRQVWSETYDRDAAAIFNIQTEVARKIAIALKGEISAAEALLLQTGADRDFEAFNLYLRGRQLWSLRTEDAFNKSLAYFNDAIERDPNYALAYAGLADAYSLAAVAGYLPREVAAARAREAATTAIGLDANLAEAQASLGYVLKNQFAWVSAEERLRRALQLRPGYALAHQWYATLLAQTGRFAEAITEIKVALSLDPLSLSTNGQFAAILVLARRYDDAIVQINRTIAMEPSFRTSHQLAAEALAYKGDLEGASRAAESGRRVNPIGGEDQELLADIGYIHAAAGRVREAYAVANLLIDRSRRGERVSAAIATVYAALEKTDDALRWLDRAADDGEAEIGYLRVEPRWDILRGDARFAQLLERAGLGTQITDVATPLQEKNR